MASSSSAGHSAFGLGRKKKSPGLMDQITKIFAGDKKKRSKGSFRGHTASPQQSSSRRKPTENAVVKFFRSLVATPKSPKSRASSSKGEGAKSPVRRRKEQGTLSRLLSLGDAKSRPPPKRWSTIF